MAEDLEVVRLVGGAGDGQSLTVHVGDNQAAWRKGPPPLPDDQSHDDPMAVTYDYYRRSSLSYSLGHGGVRRIHYFRLLSMSEVEAIHHILRSWGPR